LDKFAARVLLGYPCFYCSSSMLLLIFCTKFTCMLRCSLPRCSSVDEATARHGFAIYGLIMLAALPA